MYKMYNVQLYINVISFLILTKKMLKYKTQVMTKLFFVSSINLNNALTRIKQYAVRVIS